MSRKMLSLVAMVLALAIPMSAQAKTVKYTYVAGTLVASTAGVDHDRTTPTAVSVHVHPVGGFQFTPLNGSFTVKFSDFGSEAGAGLEVSICQRGAAPAPENPFCGDDPGDKVFFESCFPNGTTKSFTGAALTRNVAVFVFAASLGCDGAASVGEATVTGVA